MGGHIGNNRVCGRDGHYRMRIALDFDGVLHSYKQGFTGVADLPGAPVPGSLEFVTEALARDHELTVFSCRARTPAEAAAADPWLREWEPGGKEAITGWLARHGFPLLKVTGVKPIADVYIDDYGFRFEGRWPTWRKLETMRPWYYADALRGLVGNLDPHPQEILTPWVITDFVRDVFGEPIAFDPCAARDVRSTVLATERRYGKDGIDDDGLLAAWPDATFANPPYGQLKRWLAKAVQEAEPIGTVRDRIIVLTPVRSRSGWWRAARDAARKSGAVVELDRVRFVGYESTFPESLALLCFNVDPERVREIVEKRPLGEIMP